MRLLTTLICIIWSYSLCAQWQGDNAKFKLYTDSLQLNDKGAGQAYLSYPLDIVDSAQWYFDVHMQFNPSSSNYACIYLKSEQANLQGNAYYLKLGGSDDNIALYRQDAHKQLDELLINGKSDRLDLSNFSIQIKVCYTDGLWQVYSRFSQEEFVKEGEAIDRTYYQSSFFGVKANYTKTRAKLMAFSAFSWSGKSFLDTQSPRLDSLKVMSKNRIKFYFNEALSKADFSYKNKAGFIIDNAHDSPLVEFPNVFPLRDTFTINYSVSDTLNNMSDRIANAFYIPFEVTFAKMLSADSVIFSLSKAIDSIYVSNIDINQQNPYSIVHNNDQYVAYFAQAFPERTKLVFTISDLVDINGDSLINSSCEMVYVIPHFRDLIFTEIMADPTPQVGTLPEFEFVEIFNRTAYPISLENWTLEREGKSYLLPTFKLDPFSFVLLTTQDAAEAFAVHTPYCLAMPHFPSLLNTEMELALKSDKGSLIDYVYYSQDWHFDAFHRAGGFSLERIDFDNPSMVNNWESSCAEEGATPGFSNCVEAYNPDILPPHIKLAYALNPKCIFLELQDLIFKSQLENLAFYSLHPLIVIDSIQPLGSSPFANQFVLHLNDSLINYKLYELSIRGLADLSANVMQDTVVTIALCAKADSSDILFSEIMFDPHNEGVEYIELYNASDFPLDLSDYFLSQPDLSGGWSRAYALSEHSQLFMPKSYVVLTKDKGTFLKTYPNTTSVLAMPSLPSFKNTGGAWGILNKSAKVIDHMHYSPDCHSSLLDNTKGVALERHNFTTSALVLQNWQSASSLAFYATPGYANSQQTSLADGELIASLSPQNFTPDGDGVDDRVTIRIDRQYAGCSVMVKIYNQRGLLVRTLCENDLIGSYPILYWEGLDNAFQRCALGPYLVFIEIVTPESRIVYDRQELILSAKVQ